MHLKNLKKIQQNKQHLIDNVRSVSRGKRSSNGSPSPTKSRGRSNADVPVSPNNNDFENSVNQIISEISANEKAIIMNAKKVFHKKRRIHRFNQIAQMLDLKKQYENLNSLKNGTNSQMRTSSVSTHLEKKLTRKIGFSANDQMGPLKNSQESWRTNESPRNERTLNKKATSKNMALQKAQTSLKNAPTQRTSKYRVQISEMDELKARKSTVDIGAPQPTKIQSVNGWFQRQVQEGIAARGTSNPHHQSVGNIRYQRRDSKVGSINRAMSSSQMRRGSGLNVSRPQNTAIDRKYSPLKT